ncbi:MAG: glycoside hydrolase 100 family protein [Steroidobacteraceae bacterium]
MEMTDTALLDATRTRAIALLKANCSDAGMLAAGRSTRAQERGYEAIFGRDAAVCALGMLRSGDDELVRAAATGMITLAGHQARNGQLPKFVDTTNAEADFWYLGCIDSTLWWLLALQELQRHAPHRGIVDEHRHGIARALDWLLAQEHQRFFLLQQNEASDWADIMPRSGFVLYTNALWYRVKRLYGLSDVEPTRANFNGLFHPFSASLAEYRRARLLADYVLQSAKRHDLYLSFVNFSFFGEEGDVFGNALALLCGLAEPALANSILDALLQEQVQDPYPVRVVCEPILQEHFLWRPYMSRHEQNFAWQYHNGGIWPMVGGFWICALVRRGRLEQARADLVKLARGCAINDWEFNEWLHGETLQPSGMPLQSWNAAAFLFADRAVREGRCDLLAS